MPEIINLDTFTDTRGNLTVIERSIPFEIRRIFYIYGVDKSERGGHRHFNTIQAAICIQGSCEIFCNNGQSEILYDLSFPNQCLILFPEDWHKMRNFSDNCILMVLASEYYDEKDYIFEKY